MNAGRKRIIAGRRNRLLPAMENTVSSLFPDSPSLLYLSLSSMTLSFSLSLSTSLSSFFALSPTISPLTHSPLLSLSCYPLSFSPLSHSLCPLFLSTSSLSSLFLSITLPLFSLLTHSLSPLGLSLTPLSPILLSHTPFSLSPLYHTHYPSHSLSHTPPLFLTLSSFPLSLLLFSLCLPPPSPTLTRFSLSSLSLSLCLCLNVSYIHVLAYLLCIHTCKIVNFDLWNWVFSCYLNRINTIDIYRSILWWPVMKMFVRTLPFLLGAVMDVIRPYYHLSCEFKPRSWRCVLDTTLCDSLSVTWNRSVIFSGCYGFLHQ